LRIAVVAPLDAPVCEVTSRGEQIVVADLARAMKDRGHEVMLFCAQGSYLKGVDTAPVALEGSYEQLYWHVAQWEPDVISQHAPDPDAFAFAGGTATVHTLHWCPGSRWVGAVRAAHWPSVAVSHDAQRRWHDVGVAASVIPHGVPDFPVRVADPDRIALVAGRIAPERGTATAVRLAKRAGLEPIVVGDISDRAYFAREIVPLLDGVRVFRTLPRDRVWALMARASVTLMPVEWDEPFGLVAAEAQVAGCPVVAYARGALPEVIPHGSGGMLVAPGDEDALVDAIPVAQAFDRVTIREDARDRFDLTAMMDAHEELLAEAATGMARVRPAA
jgi:glycosyltransferase involved in cell wall biosynthesis